MASDTPFGYWFDVDHVYDGDTIMGRLDRGMAEYDGGLPSLQKLDRATFSLRLFGINAPELNASDAIVRAAATASRDNLRRLVAPGDYIRVVSMGWDKFSKRIDAIPFVGPYTVDEYGIATGGVNLCQAQLAGGFAVPYLV